MKRTLHITISIILGIMLITGNSSAQYDVPLNLAVGDRFDYTFQYFRNSQIINGTDYTPTSDEEFPMDFEIIVDDITLDPSGPDFFQSSATYVNYTVDDGETTEVGSSIVDTWELFLIIGILVAALGVNVPEPGDFAYEEEDEEDPSETVSDLPIFVNSNTTAYEESAALPNSNIDDSAGQGVEIYNYETFSSLSGDIYTQRFALRQSDTERVDGVDVFYDFKFAVDIVIDISKSIIQELYYEVGSILEYGDDASLEGSAAIYMGLTSVVDPEKYNSGYFGDLDPINPDSNSDNDGGPLGDLDLPINFVSVLAAFIVVPILIRKKK